MRSNYIVIEGLEGAGKTTARQLVVETLQSAGIHDMVFTREPGGTILAEKLRSLVLDIQSTGDEVINDKAEVLMFYAARVQLVETVIKPALARGQWVIGDRHDLSTQAYQGGGRGIDRTMLATLRDAVLGDFRPNLTLYLDVTPEVGLQRARARKLPEDLTLPVFEEGKKSTRAASGEVLSELADQLPELWGGSADLAGSNNTTMDGEPSFLPLDRQSKKFPGNPTRSFRSRAPLRIVGELVDCIIGKNAISIMTATDDMVDEAHIVRSQCLYAQASSLARTVLNLPVCITAVANIKYKQPVTVGDKLIAKAEVMRQRDQKYYVWVTIRKMRKEVFRAKFIIESLE